jgi:two-component system response regulator FixJ
MSQTPATASAQGPVFIVEPDSALRRSLNFSLGIDGYRVETYQDAEAFLAAAHDVTQGSCLVVDYRLPDMDGIQLIERLRASGSNLPAILIVTNPSADLARRVAEADIALVEKPLLGTTLLDAIGDVLSVAPQESS